MEKKSPHFPLVRVKEYAQAGSVRITRAAYAGAAELGIDKQGMLNIVCSLCARDFYKSMTFYNDHTQWQDVYRPESPEGKLYLKLSIDEGLLIISFKEA